MTVVAPKVLDYLHQHPDRLVTAAEISRSTGLEIRQIQRVMAAMLHGPLADRVTVKQGSYAWLFRGEDPRPDPDDWPEPEESPQSDQPVQSDQMTAVAPVAPVVITGLSTFTPNTSVGYGGGGGGGASWVQPKRSGRLLEVMFEAADVLIVRCEDGKYFKAMLVAL